MRAEDLYAFTRRQPFVPFRIHSTDARTYEVWHPDQVIPMRSRVSGQIMEAGVQAYTGRYSPYLAPIDTSFGEVVPTVDPANGVLDQRIGGTFVYYPQPFGIPYFDRCPRRGVRRVAVTGACWRGAASRG